MLPLVILVMSPSGSLENCGCGRATASRQAILQERRAMVTEPASAQYQSGMAEVHLNCRRYDEALTEFEKAFTLGRDSVNVYWNLGETYFHQGQFQKALAMYGKTGQPPPGWARVALGSRTEALAQIRALQGQWARGTVKGWNVWLLARLYTSLGQPVEAITWLERAYEERAGIMVYLNVEPHFDPLRGQPRFQALLRKTGFAN